MGPLVIVIAATGAIYVFKDELETVLYRDLIFEEAGNWRQADAQAVNKMTTRVLSDFPGYRLYGLELESGTDRAPALGLINPTAEPRFRRVFVSSDFEGLRGELTQPNFFSVVLALHRNLVTGTPGRIFVELATCWLIVSSVMGIYLWWPKNWSSLKGVLIPRWKAKAYIVTRDLHSIVGIVLCAFLLLVAATGLIYTRVWGTLFSGIGVASGQYDPIVNPPKLLEPMGLELQDLPTQGRLAAQGMLLAQRLEPRFTRVSVVLPESDVSTIAIEAGPGYGPYISYAAYHDPGDGALVASRTIWETPPMVVWLLWNYPLHVGSFGGVITKWLWLVLAIAAVGLPISGYAMMWIRVRRGKPLLPRADRLAPGRIRWAFIASAVIFPMVGISLLLVLVGMAARWIFLRRRQSRASTVEMLTT